MEDTNFPAPEKGSSNLEQQEVNAHNFWALGTRSVFRLVKLSDKRVWLLCFETVEGESASRQYARPRTIDG